MLDQPWCDGRLATLGPSYLGLTQWALAPAAGRSLRAMGTLVTASSFRDQTYAGGSFSLDNALSWSSMMRTMAAGPFARVHPAAARARTVTDALDVLPLRDADRRATGDEVDFFQDWLRESDPGSAYWARRGYTAGVAEVARADVDVTMTGGFQDIFLPWQLADHAALRAAGARPRLVLGPWVHTSGPGIAAGLRESLAAFERVVRRHARPRRGRRGHHRGRPGVGDALRRRGRPASRRLAAARRRPSDLVPARRPLPVDQPPPDRPQAPSLARHPHRLRPGRPHARRRRPDPHRESGPRDQAALEARTDVAVFSSDPLAEDVVALGPVSATVFLRAEVEHLDVFVRVCDVDPRGRSVNVTDGLVRLAPGVPATAADGSRGWPSTVGHRAPLRRRPPPARAALGRRAPPLLPPPRDGRRARRGRDARAPAPRGAARRGPPDRGDPGGRAAR